jgi:hypothetical protein
MIIDSSILTSKSHNMNANKPQLSGKLIRIGAVLLFILLFMQCDGPTGPMGPMGPQGNDGQDGTAFAYSVIYDVQTSEWFGNADGYRVTLDVPEITEDIYYNGAVLVYRLIEIEPNSFNLLPYTYVDNALTIYMDFDAYVGSIELIYKEIYDGVNDTYAPASLMSFKVMIIEGIPLATLKTKVDVNDYGAVTKLLNDNKINSKEIRLY